MKQMPSLLAPAGGMRTLETALRFGADAVYLGAQAYGLRAQAQNFDEAQLARAVELAHARGAQVHLTLNIFAFDGDLPGMVRTAKAAQEMGVDAVIVRPGHIYGPTATASDGRVSSAFPREVLAGRDIVMKSPGTQLRSYCYVLDCASALVTVLLAGASGHAYNISNKDSVVTIRQMAEAFAQAAGRQVRFADPTAAEAAVFNPMDCSALDAAALEALGWRGLFDLGQGVAATLDAM